MEVVGFEPTSKISPQVVSRPEGRQEARISTAAGSVFSSQSSFAQTDPEIARYVYETIRPEDEMLQFARENARIRGLPDFELSGLDARHLEVVVRLMGAKKAVEIGTLGGYSGISIARAMGAGGRLHTFDVDPYHGEVARAAFSRAQLLSEVVIHVGPALENLPRIANEAPYDLLFIDADRVNYTAYLEWATNHLRIGGAVIADSAFAAGQVHRLYDLPQSRKAEIEAIRKFNHLVATSGRFRSTIFPTGEGLTIAVKIS